jgi:hypothetical protein
MTRVKNEVDLSASLFFITVKITETITSTKISPTRSSRKQFFTTKRGSTKFQTKEVMLLGLACL